MDNRLRAWTPSVGVGIAVLLVGVLELVNTDVVVDRPGYRGLALLVLAAAVIAGLARRQPGPALVLACLVGVVQVTTGTQIMAIELAFFVVVFCAARWGHVVTVVAALLSIPAAAAAAVYLALDSYYVPLLSVSEVRDLLDTANRFGDSTRVGVTVFVMVVLAAPWLAGLAFRFSDRARESRASQVRAEESEALAVVRTEQAQEIARLRDEQARLARDVHDVVGHSLAVILAQAESAQYLPDDDPARLKQTMATIAGSARSSLQEVRQVLASTDRTDASDSADATGAASAARPLDTLVDGVRSGGHEVVVRELGTPRPLPPELEVTAYRVLQEMLTNAVKHGRRDEPVFVERHWPDDSLSDDLRLEVRNAVADAAGERGRGLDGMRQRLEAVGGRLDARRRDAEDGSGEPASFTVTAWLPLGPR